MSAFPDDIWHAVSKYLKPKELHNFIRTNHHAKDVVSPSEIAYMKLWGPILKEFDKIFKNYDWVETVESYGLALIIIYCDEEKSYLDLCLGEKEVPWIEENGRRYKSGGFGDLRGSEEIQRAKKIVFDKIFQSLRCQQTAEAADQIKFPKFTLSLRGVLSPGYIPTWHFGWAMAEDGPRDIDIVIYGQGIYKTKASSYSSQLLKLPVAGFESLYYVHIANDVAKWGHPINSYDCSVPTGAVKKRGRKVWSH